MMQEQSFIDVLWKFSRKLFVSIFVIVSFFVYVLHERLGEVTNTLSDNPKPDGAASTQVAGLTNSATPTSPAESQTNELPTAPPSIFQPLQPASLPLATPTPTPVVQGQYRNGDYVGSEIDAYYGLVQVKATIQNGQIVGVDFLEYPNDRRTSQRINQVAMPYLKTEALRAQTANVNIISGATLTSEAFILSLRSALNSAKP